MREGCCYSAAQRKYHFSGLWTNTCCGHPRRSEALWDAVHRRLWEEFGFDTKLQEMFSFVYRASDSNSRLTEHEFDHVFFGVFDGQPHPSPDEVEEWKWVGIEEFKTALERYPQDYTPWFRMIVSRVVENLPSPAPHQTLVSVSED